MSSSPDAEIAKLQATISSMFAERQKDKIAREKTLAEKNALQAQYDHLQMKHYVVQKRIYLLLQRLTRERSRNLSRARELEEKLVEAENSALTWKSLFESLKDIRQKESRLLQQKIVQRFSSYKHQLHALNLENDALRHPQLSLSSPREQRAPTLAPEPSSLSEPSSDSSDSVNCADSTTTAAAPSSSSASFSHPSGKSLAEIPRGSLIRSASQLRIGTRSATTSQPMPQGSLLNFAEKQGRTTLVSASLRGLVDHLTSEAQNFSSFSSQFILTYPSFCSARDLAKVLFERFSGLEQPPGVSYPDWDKKLNMIQLRVLNFLKNWILQQPSDFTENREVAMFILQKIRADVVPVTGMGGLAIQLERLLTSENPAKRYITASIPSQCHAPIHPTGTELTDFDMTEVSRQWSLLNWQLFSALRPRDFLSLAKPPYPAAIQRIFERHSRLKLWTASIILEKKTHKDRSDTLKAFVLLADQLGALKNYEGAAIVVESLSLHCITRLEKSWARLPAPVQRTFQALKALFTPGSVFEAYRNTFAKVAPPMVPWLDPLFQQLLPIKQLSPSSDSGNLIPWERCSQLYDLVSSNLNGQTIPYPIQLEPTIHAYLSSAGNDLSEDTLHALSIACEPD
ncbi:MAG: RasGEF domain-containing protein [archaeon]|nr:RasGEF domain-containing protein [archaeon]